MAEFLTKAVKHFCTYRNFSILNSICDHSANFKDVPSASNAITGWILQNLHLCNYKLLKSALSMRWWTFVVN